MFKETDFAYRSTYLLVHEAQKRGYQVSKIFPGTRKSYVRVIREDGRIAIIVGQRIPSLSYGAYFVCKNKQITKQFLDQAGISVPKGNIFKIDDQEKIIEYVNKSILPVVIKPLDGTWGAGVCMNVVTKSDVIRALRTIRTAMKKVSFINSIYCLVEEQVAGKEYRILAARNKLLGIIHRIPANIIGDGHHTIQQLIDIKNSDPRRGDKHEKSLVKIRIDEEILDNLRKKNMALDYVPDTDEVVYLRNNSNLSAGGDSVDYTDQAHPNIAKLAMEVICAIPGLPYAGFDLLISDITQDPYATGYAVIEINDSPMLSMHHEPFQGKNRNVSKDVIDLLFD